MDEIKNIPAPSPGVKLSPKGNEQSEKAKTKTTNVSVKGESAQQKKWDPLFKKLEIYDINQTFQLKFSVDKASGRTVIKIIDPETKEVIRIIPPEETLKVAAYIKKWTENIINTTA